MTTLILIIVIALNLVATLVVIIRMSSREPVAAPTPPSDVAPGAPPVPDAPPITIDIKALQEQAQAAFTKAVAESAAEFKQDVHGASGRLSDLIVQLTTNVVEQELETYRTELAKARDTALQSLRGMQDVITAKQTELEQGIDAELVVRKEELLKQLDAKLGAAVMTYVVQRLGQGVDLGAQRTYLLDSLERHKAELKQDLEDAL